MKKITKDFSNEIHKITFHKNKIPVIQNYEIKSYEKIDSIRKALIKQLYSPVYWTKTVKQFELRDIDIVIECGPNKILSGLHKRITPSMTYFNTANIENLKEIKI